mgnify:CR=1 FL=1
MAELLNLRERKDNKNPTTPRVAPQIEEKKESPDKKTGPSFSWQFTYVQRQSPTLLYIFISILILSGSLLVILVRDWTLGVFLIFIGISLIIFYKKEKKILSASINDLGLGIEEQFYYFRNMNSFWIDYSPNGPKDLSLEIKKWYYPYIKIPIDDLNPIDLRSFLVDHLPEKEHEPTIVDVIIKNLGF